jgi:hypothetical protein
MILKNRMIYLLLFPIVIFTATTNITLDELFELINSEP